MSSSDEKKSGAMGAPEVHDQLSSTTINSVPNTCVSRDVVQARFDDFVQHATDPFGQFVGGLLLDARIELPASGEELTKFVLRALEDDPHLPIIDELAQQCCAKLWLDFEASLRRSS